MIQGISVLRFTTWVVLTGIMINVSVLEIQPPIQSFLFLIYWAYRVSKSPSCNVAVLTLDAWAAR